MHLFISYAKKDTRELALALTKALNALDGITAWVDDTLKAGRSWELQIQTEIDKCNTMIVLYSPDINRHKSGQEESYVLTEIHYAKRIAKKRIIPVMAVPTDPPMSLALEQYIDFTLDELTLTDLVEALCNELGLAAPSPVALNTEMMPNSPPLYDNEDPDTSKLSVFEVFGLPKPREELAHKPPADSVEAALGRARTFNGKRNRDWTPFITMFNDLKITSMPFCLVPVGSFRMGADDLHDDTKPIHPQTISKPYYIAQYPVTNAQWALGVKAGVVKEPGKVPDWYHDSQMADAPVVGVSWREVKKFVKWMGCRLPTELEWEYAARGVESLVYPWGNEWKPDWCVYVGNSGGQPALVSSKPEGASWVGARHMSGNVWEWGNTNYASYPYKANDGHENSNTIGALHVIRGGSWNGNDNNVRAANRNWYDDTYELNRIGFRCALSLKTALDSAFLNPGF